MPTTATYTTLPGTLGGPLSQRRSGQSRFYVPDHQGNTRLLTDSAASLTDTLLTDAWGVEIVSTGTTVNPFKAFGQWGYFSDTISRKLVRARQLIVTNGRWISPDPLSIGMVYAYVESRPTFLADPSGMDPKYDPTYPCDAKIKGRIAEICKKIVELNITSTGNQSPRVRIANCFQESMGKLPAPWSCPPLFSYEVQGSMSIGELLKNMKDLCGEKSKWTIRCDSSKDCTKCANSKVTLSDPGEDLVSCVTTLCIAQENDKNCLDLGGDKRIPFLDFNILHEASHCAGLYDHGKWRSPCGKEEDLPVSVQCQDTMACCIWHVLFGPSLNSWRGKCDRHSPAESS